MIITVRGAPGATTGTLTFDGQIIPCALGRAGIVTSEAKREGDGATPAGNWPLRRVLYRPDRLDKPRTALPAYPIAPTDGWCDDPADPLYNKPTTLPYPASAETLWRDDELYNLCVVLGHNDDPVIPKRGSAIFFHVAKEKSGALCATEGCVALQQDEIIRVLMKCTPDTHMEIVRES